MGNIGAGKTTLVEKVAEEHDIYVFDEQFEKN